MSVLRLVQKTNKVAGSRWMYSQKCFAPVIQVPNLKLKYVPAQLNPQVFSSPVAM